MDNNEIEYNQNNNNSYMGNIQQFSNEQPSMTPYNQNKRPVNFPNQQMNSFPDQGVQQLGINQGYQQPGLNQGFNQGYQQQGYNQRPVLMNQNYMGNMQNAPTNPNPEKAKKKYTVQIILLITFVLVIGVALLAIFMNWGPFKQSGGKASVNELFDAYIKAINDRDTDSYMKLLLKAERMSEERKAVKKMMSDFTDDQTNMTLVVGSSKDLGDAKKKSVSEKLNNMSMMPVRVDSVQEVDATLKYGDEEKHVKFTVIESCDKFFIDDVMIK